MSRIEKLSISGIRSFSPNHKEAIQFNTPLTLIVGYNGSGKTTIIECLKYATTGEMPPNSKGGAFVHDPKLCGEKEVLAQVKLSFKSTNGLTHVVTRSVQLTVKKNTKSLKTLEGSLVQIAANGDRAQVSHRNAKLDELVPSKLGVSPAILDAVIFCHQDESLWPMSEPSVLKKRFDEIFEALKYTKAVDNLKTLRKKQGEELTKLKLMEEQDRVNKDRGEKCEKRSLQLQRDIENARTKCEDITREMAETQDRARQKHEQANSFLRIVDDLKNKKDQLDYRHGIAAELRATLDELHEDDGELENMIARFEDRMDRLQTKADQNNSQYVSLQQNLAQTRQTISTNLAEQGKHQSDRDKHERQLKLRLDLMRHAATRYDVRASFDGDLTEAQAQAFHDQIQKLLAEKKLDLDRLQKASATEIDQATATITTLEGRKAARLQDRVFAKQRIGAIEQRSTAIQADLNGMDLDEGAKSILEQQFQDVDARLKRAQVDTDSSSWDKQIQDENEKLWQLETQNGKLGQELLECTRLVTERAQLDFRKKELSDRSRKLTVLTNSSKDKLSTLLAAADWEPKDVEQRYQAVLKRQGKAVVDAQKVRDQERASHQKAGFRLKAVREALDRNSDEASNCEKAVAAALKAVRDDATVPDYPDEVSFVESQVESLKNDLSLFDALREYYDKCKSYLASKSRCLLCDHAFDGKEAANRSWLEKKIEKFLDPKKKDETKQELTENAANLDKLVSVRSQYERLQTLTAERPGLQEECVSVEAQAEAQDRQLEECETDARAEAEKLSEMESMSKTIMTIAQAWRDVTEAEGQIERVMTQQQSTMIMSARSADEIHELQAKCAEQMRTCKTRVTKLSTDRQRMKDQINGLELERSEIRNEMSTAARQLERQQDFQKQMRALKDELGSQRERIQAADQALETVEKEMAEGRVVREEVVWRWRAKEQAMAEERDAVAKTSSELAMVELDIRHYADGGASSRLEANQRALAGLEQAVAATEREMSELTVRTNQMRQEIETGDRKKRNMLDNVQYRKNMRMLEELGRAIEQLEARNADEDYDELERAARLLDNQSNRQLAERGTLMGCMKTKDEELELLIREWDQDYKDAARRYRESHIKVEATRAAIEDLGRYGAALDRAIMQYHSLKMEEINRIAGELWQATYQGTDIDTILIRSDAETATGRRNYNYRLCMVKQDTEMDMRGRCSAGQKVLASIIVRLALAESFGSHCGVVALDEPTTNLDRDNIRALAESLHAILRARRAQANLQLVVITHDEEFLRHMRCSDFCDSFFRVRRDDKQNSVISRESITTVM